MCATENTYYYYSNSENHFIDWNLRLVWIEIAWFVNHLTLLGVLLLHLRYLQSVISKFHWAYIDWRVFAVLASSQMPSIPNFMQKINCSIPAVIPLINCRFECIMYMSAFAKMKHGELKKRQSSQLIFQNEIFSWIGGEKLPQQSRLNERKIKGTL